MSTIKTISIFSVLSLVLGCAIPVDRMSVKTSFLSAAGEDISPNRIPQEEFTQADQIGFFTVMEWADVGEPAGLHEVTWKWYNNDRLVRVEKKEVEFSRTPYELWSYMRGESLGSGKNKVEVYIDGKRVASNKFSVN